MGRMGVTMRFIHIHPGYFVASARHQNTFFSGRFNGNITRVAKKRGLSPITLPGIRARETFLCFYGRPPGLPVEAVAVGLLDAALEWED